MIDIGANLSHEQFAKDTQAVLERAKQSGVEEIILTTTDIKSFEKNVRLIEQYQQTPHTPKLTTTLGLHPHQAHEHAAFFKFFQHNYAHPMIRAVGEFGLDYFRMLTPQDVQIKVMSEFLDLAQKPELAHLPLFLHERDAVRDFLAVLDNQPVSNPHIVHCFTGDKAALRAYLDRDYYIGITGWISDTKRGMPLREALKYLPLERLLIETDAPYLTPKNMPQKSYRNEPAFLIYTAQAIAEIKETTPQTVIDYSTSNAQTLFKSGPRDLATKMRPTGF